MLTQPNPLDEVQPADLAHMIRQPRVDDHRNSLIVDGARFLGGHCDDAGGPLDRGAGLTQLK